MAEQDTDPGLNLDHNEARAVHRVVRAMHDGECPRCHTLRSSELMRFTDVQVTVIDAYVYPPLQTEKFLKAGWRCPSCLFEITDADAEAAIAQFAKFMDKNLEVFEKWRATRARLTQVPPPSPN